MDTNLGQVVLVRDINPNVTNVYYGETGKELFTLNTEQLTVNSFRE